MTKLDWRMVDLEQGVLREPTPDENRIILWLPGQVAQGFRHWERITNVPGAEVAVEQGICSVPAVSMPARQKLWGLLGKIFPWLGKPAGPETWLLPTGGYVEKAGERETGLFLIW